MIAFSVFIFLAAFLARSEQVADVKGPAKDQVKLAETTQLNADSFYNLEAKRDPSWPKKLEVVNSARTLSIAEFNALLTSKPSFPVRVHCDGYPVLAAEAGIKEATQKFMPLDYLFNPNNEKDVFSVVLTGGPLAMGAKYKYRVEGGAGKFNFIRISYDAKGKRVEEVLPARIVEILHRERPGEPAKKIDTAIEFEGAKVCNDGKKPVRELLILPKADVVAGIFWAPRK